MPPRPTPSMPMVYQGFAPNPDRLVQKLGNKSIHVTSRPTHAREVGRIQYVNLIPLSPIIS